HAVERAHVGVHREALERLGEAAPRYRIRERGEHAPLLAREAAQLLAEAQQVGLRLVRLAAHRIELAPGALAVLREELLVLGQRERGLRLAATPCRRHTAARSPSTGRAGSFGRLWI